MLQKLTDGVLVLQHTDNDDGILLVNQSLHKMFNVARETKRKLTNKDVIHNKLYGQYELQRKKSSSVSLKRRQVGPKFDKLFGNMNFKIMYEHNETETENRHTQQEQFLCDFICKQMDFFTNPKLPQGYSENVIIKLIESGVKLELNIVKLEDQSQTLFLFKEMSIYNKLSFKKNMNKMQNLMLNSISHNLYTPINGLIELNKNMSTIVEIQTEQSMKVMQMMGICLQQLVFTIHSIIELSKIRIGKFQPMIKEVNFPKLIQYLTHIFVEDLRFRDIHLYYELDDTLETTMIKTDETRLSIIFFNVVANSVKSTSSGTVEVTAKIIGQEEYQREFDKLEKNSKIKKRQSIDDILSI